MKIQRRCVAREGEKSWAEPSFIQLRPPPVMQGTSYVGAYLVLIGLRNELGLAPPRSTIFVSSHETNLNQDLETNKALNSKRLLNPPSCRREYPLTLSPLFIVEVPNLVLTRVVL